jgi:nucleoside-diphosphate-sugar epimerase
VERLQVDFSREVSLPPCDLFFHVAGVLAAPTYADYLAVNRDAARRAFLGARAGRFILVSSLAACGPGERVDESTPCAPVSLYGRSKWEGEQEVWTRRDRLPVTVVRPPVVYGPRDSGLVDAYRIVARGLQPRIGGRKWISLIHARELAEGLLAAAESPHGAGEVFYLSNPQPVEMSELWEVVARALGVRTLVLPVPDRVVRLAGAVVEEGARWLGRFSLFGRDKALEMTQKAWTCNPSKARLRLGWSTRLGLEEGMRQTLEWYQLRGLV